MSAPQPLRHSDGRVHTMQRPEDGIIVYRAESGWWNLGALPPLAPSDMLFQIERAWNESGVNPGHHAKMKREVRERMPILAAYLDLLTAPQNVIAQRTTPPVSRPRQSGETSTQRTVLGQALTVACTRCGSEEGVMCVIPDSFMGADRIHIARLIDAGLGSPETPR